MVRVPGPGKAGTGSRQAYGPVYRFEKVLCKCDKNGPKATYVTAADNGNESVLPAGWERDDI